MGANAVTTVPVYTAGEVLTAANLNITNSGIPVFATTTTRDAAFGGAGEKTLAEGQMAYIEASNTTQYYDGAAWQTLGPTGLAVVVSETAFTAVSTLQVNNCFTSTYTNYLINFRFSAFSASSQGAYLRESASGTPNATNYSFQQLLQTSTTVTGFQNLTDTQAGLLQTDTNGGMCQVNLFGPNLAANTHMNIRSYSNNRQEINACRHADTTAYDGFYVFLLGGATMTGTYTVYGYSK